MTKPTRARIKKVVQYDPVTGLFRRRAKTGFKGFIGQPMGGVKSHGYLVFQIDGHRDYAHRFAWIYMTGRWPKEIDHINGDRADNRWTNLRKATRFLNNGNRKKVRGSLPKGVIRLKDRHGSLRFYGRIVVGGKQITCGPWRTDPDIAHKDYMKAAQYYYGAFARAK